MVDSHQFLMCHTAINSDTAAQSEGSGWKVSLWKTAFGAIGLSLRCQLPLNTKDFDDQVVMMVANLGSWPTAMTTQSIMIAGSHCSSDLVDERGECCVAFW